jgi:hypothetical protein
VGLLVLVAATDLLREVADPKVEPEAVDPTQVQLVLGPGLEQEEQVVLMVADPRPEELMHQALLLLVVDPKFAVELVEQKELLEP